MPKIIVLDPESTDPTWGMMQDAQTLDLTQDEWDNLDHGHWSVRDILDDRRQVTLEAERLAQRG